MKDISKILITILLCGTCIKMSAQRAIVSYPSFPVLAGTEDNIVAEISLRLDNTSFLDSISIELSGIESKAIGRVKLKYSGSMSVIPSNTKSFVMKDMIKRYGGGQNLWNDSDFVRTIGICNGENIKFNCNLPLQKGIHHFQISAEVFPDKVRKISDTFRMNISCLSIGGKNIIPNMEGNPSRRLAIPLRQSGQDGVCAYRIPGIVTTPSGTLVAVYDIRHDSSLDLQNNIDIGMSRSIDGGRTWEKMKTIMDMGEWGGLPHAQNGIGDPCILVDSSSGEIFVLALWTHGLGGDRAWTAAGQGVSAQQTGQLMLCRSKDDGVTWSEPQNITSQVKQNHWYLTLQGPGRGISMDDGTLVFPFQYIDSTRIPYSSIIFSKDKGENWKVFNGAKANTTESSVVELSPGRLMLNMRDNRKTGRAVHITDDMGKTWTEHPSSGSLIEPVCMASLIKIKAEDNIFGKDILLFSNPATSKGRNHMTIKASLDGGYTWKEENSLMLDAEELWGYSCLTMIDRETVGILYEGSTSQLVFQAIKLEDIIHCDDATPSFEDIGLLDCGSQGSEKGLSAMFCGLVSGQVVCAGGTNFPEVPLINGGKKHYYKDIFRFKDKWEKCGELPCPLAYGATFSIRGMMLTVGGNDGNGPVRSVYCISEVNDNIKVRELNSPLPEALEQAGYASKGREIYIAGGFTHNGVSRNIYKGVFTGNEIKWSLLGKLPQSLVQPVTMVYKNRLIVWGGFDPIEKKASSTCWEIDLHEGKCKESGQIPDNGTFTGSAIVVLNDGKAAVIGGTDREIFNYALNAQGKQQEDYLAMPPSHYKFNRKIRIYNPVDNSWLSTVETGMTALAGAGCVFDGDYIYIIGGETKPGIRTSQTWKIPVSLINK